MSEAKGTLDDQRREWFEQACARIDRDRLKQLIRDLVNIHSPTGAEAEIASFLAGHLQAAGLDAGHQSIGRAGGNAWGRIRGTGEGPRLLLYAPLDTHLDADEATDVPWVGPRLRRDMIPEARVEGDMVIGLGASNPKSMVASLVEAARCVADAGIPLTGEALVAAAGGGMPWAAEARDGAGISSGVMHLLSRGVTADFGVILKPWDAVFYEHPGMAWFKVTTWGTLGYAGIPRGAPGFRSAIVPAAQLILELEHWLIEYPQAHLSAQVEPQGWLAAVRSGWPSKPALPAAACEIYLDVRTNPDQTMAGIEAEFGAVMRGILARHEDIEATWEMTVSCQGSRTDPEHWIVRSGTRAWEAIHGEPYPGTARMSGQTDAATICQMGIPLVRLGFPFMEESAMPEEYAEGLGGMGVARVSDLVDPCRSIIYTIIDSCTRTREEVGLTC